MIFTSIPDNYAPINEPLLYQFSLGGEQATADVKIIDVAHDRTIATRRLYGVQSGQIDVAPYLKRCFEFAPIDGDISIGDATGLYADIVVEVDGERSEERLFSPYQVSAGVGTLFRADTKLQNLSLGESDYIVIYAPLGGVVSCEFYTGETIGDRTDMTIAAQPGLQILKIGTESLMPEVDSMLVEINLDGVVDYLSYRIVPRAEGAKRLVWLTPKGMVQAYTFPTCRSHQVRIEKQRIESHNGYKIVAGSAEKVLSLISDYETAAKIEQLGTILEAEYVYLDGGSVSQRVDVVSTESVVRYGGALNSLQVDIRACDRKEELL